MQAWSRKLDYFLERTVCRTGRSRKRIGNLAHLMAPFRYEPSPQDIG